MSEIGREEKLLVMTVCELLKQSKTVTEIESAYRTAQKRLIGRLRRDWISTSEIKRNLVSLIEIDDKHVFVKGAEPFLGTVHDGDVVAPPHEREP